MNELSRKKWNNRKRNVSAAPAVLKTMIHSEINMRKCKTLPQRVNVNHGRSA